MITNPYLKTKSETVGWKSELKRLFGGPQLILSLVLVLIPLVLAVCGGIDFGNKFIYEMRGQKDTRKSVWLVDCTLAGSGPLASAGSNGTSPVVSDPTKAQIMKLCKDKSGKVKTNLWPPFLPSNEPYYYALPLLLAFLSFVSIGNPRFLKIGDEFKKVFGIGGGSGSNAGSDDPSSPYADPVKHKTVWMIGGATDRKWQPDPGYFFQDPKSLKPFCLNPDMLRTNLLIVAPPGSGKTSSIFRPLIAYLRSIGASAIFFDSKGADFDRDLFDLNFELSDPANSIKINLFSGETPAQAGERLGEALIVNLSDDKQYYVDVAKDAMAALVSGHHAVYSKFPDLTELLLYLSESEKINDLEARVRQITNLGEIEVERIGAGMRRITSLLTNSKKDTLGSINTALTPLTTSAAAELLVANPSLDPAGEKVFTIEEMLREPRLVRFSLPVAENPRIAPIIGRIILTQFNFAVLSPTCNKNILKIAAVDEAHNFITGSIGKGMAQARSNYGGFLLALQTLSQIPDDSLLDTIFAAAGTKLVMAGVGDQDADRFSKTFGELEMPYITHSKSVGRTSSINTSTGNTTSVSAGRSATGGSSQSGGGSTNSTGRSTSSTSNQSSSQQLKLRRLFLASEVRSLPQYHAIAESSDAFGRRWGAQMIDMGQPTLESILAKANKGKSKKKVKLAKDNTLAEDEGKSKKVTTPALVKPEPEPLVVRAIPVPHKKKKEEVLAEVAPSFGKFRVSTGSRASDSTAQIEGWEMTQTAAPAAREMAKVESGRGRGKGIDEEDFFGDVSQDGDENDED